MSDVRDGGFDDLLDAIDAGEPFYLTCPEGNASLPPKRICPECHSRELTREPLSMEGSISTYTVVAVPAPRFSDTSPYVTAIADFGPVSLTGQLQGVDPSDVTVGQPVTIGVEAVDGDRFVAFSPR